jgi:hypothetical protein
LKQVFLIKNFLLAVFVGIALISLLLPACRHELGQLPFGPIDPTDTIVIPPPPPPDPVDTSGVPCSPDTVYFQNQILPLLVSNCAMSACHDVQSHQEGIILTNYTNIRQKVVPFNASQSKIYKSIIDTDPGDRMPRPPAPAFTPEQKNLVKKWIEQGALNNVCNESYGQCDTMNITYTAYLQPLLASKCVGCHGVTNPGGGIKLTSYAEVKASAQSGKLYGSIAWLYGFKLMPQSGAQLSSCQISKVKAWVDSGMPQ